MKRFLIISIISVIQAFAICQKTNACIHEGPTYNYYMFYTCPYTAGLFDERINKFWQEYSDGRCNTYRSFDTSARDIAEEKGDKEMLAYMDALDKYIEICDELKERWSYPTPEQLSERTSLLQQMLAKCKAYKGTRLRQQYALLLMRVQMLLGKHYENTKYWTDTASKIKPGVYRDMMENIYANALLNTGRRQDACDIYARQGDWRSIKWMMRKHRNLAGIKALYAERPNSPTLLYLVEDFVNNVQETQDAQNSPKDEYSFDTGFNEEWIEEIGRKVIYTDEAMQFITFAQNVLAEGKTQCPCMWQTAIGTLMYLMNDREKALDVLDKAMTMKGSSMMHDNARCIRLICSASISKLTPEYEKYLTNEMKWLDSKIVSTKDNPNPTDGYGYFTRMKERLIHRNLIPRYRAEGNNNIPAYMLGMMWEMNINREAREDDELFGYWNYDYNNIYFNCLDRMNADEMIEYYNKLKSGSGNELELYLKSKVYNNDAYYNDIIGTKLIAEGRFEDAVPYLEKVPLSFICKQNIAVFMAKRDFSKPKWLIRQPVGSEAEEETIDPLLIKKNLKTDFCQEMIKLTSLYNLSRPNSNKRRDYAYELATRYFQASCYGDCWFITHYGKSINDSALTNEKDFAAAAIEYLCESKLSKDKQIKEESLYALAYIPTEPWRAEVYDDKNYTYCTVFNRSRQYFALQELNSYALKNPKDISTYISKCDVLMEFRRKN